MSRPAAVKRIEFPEALAAARRDAADHERAWVTLRRLLGLPETPHDHGRDVLEALDTMQRARDEARRALEALVKAIEPLLPLPPRRPAEDVSGDWSESAAWRRGWEEGRRNEIAAWEAHPLTAAFVRALAALGGHPAPAGESR